MQYGKVPDELLKKINFDAGVIVAKDGFDPVTGKVKQGMIIGATSGGSQFNATITRSNLFDDIDNVPGGAKQGAKIDKYEPHLTATLVTIDEDSLGKMLVKYEKEENSKDSDGRPVGRDFEHFQPKQGLIPESNFFDLWVITDYAAAADERGNLKTGFFAIYMRNCIDVGGFQKQNTNNGKSTYSVDFMAHYDAEDVETVPFEIYMSTGAQA